MLNEFSALRAEINRRSDAQDKIVGLHLTALAAIVALLVENKVDARYAMILTLLSTTLGLLWADHHRQIAKIGHYIGEQIWRWEPSWEDAHGGRGRLQDVLFSVPIATLFVGSAVTGLIWSRSDSPLDGWWCALWWTSLATLLVLLVAWANGKSRPARSGERVEANDPDRAA